MSQPPKASKVALITGASRRIGAAIARSLHTAGMNIVLHYNVSEEAAGKLCEEFNRKRNHSAVVVRADLLMTENIQSLIKSAAETWQRLDILVNNASRFYRSEVGEVTDYAWDDLMNCNVKAPYFLSQAAAPYLAIHQGAIVNITDIHAETPLRHYSVYTISKSGLLMMTRALAKELAPLIRVNAVAPGSIIWPEGENALSEQVKQKIIDDTPLARSGSPEEIAKAVLFLARDAEFVTGQVLNVDGGRSIA